MSTPNLSAQLEQLGKQSRLSALLSAAGLTVLLGSLIASSLLVARSSSKLEQAHHELDALNAEVTQLTQTEQQKQARLVELQHEIDRASAASTDINHRVEELRSQLEKLQSETATPTAQALEPTLRSASNALASLEQTNQQLKSVAAESHARLQTAQSKEAEGFKALAAGAFRDAASAFSDAESAYPGYHNAYEISKLLQKNRAALSEPQQQQQVLKKISSDFAAGAPPGAIERLEPK